MLAGSNHTLVILLSAAPFGCSGFEEGVPQSLRANVNALLLRCPAWAGYSVRLMGAVDQHGAEDQGAADYVLPVLVDVHQSHAVDEEAEEYHAYQGAADATFAADQVGAADDDGGNDVQFPASCGAGRAGHDLCGLHDACQCRQQSDDGHDTHLDTAHVDAAESRCFGVAADCVDGAAEGGVTH